MGQKHSYTLNRAKVTRQSTQIIQDEIASTEPPARPSEPVPLGVRNSLDGSDYVRREMERQEQQKLAKCQENGATGQEKVEETPPKSEEHPVEADASDQEAENMSKCQEMVEVAESNEENLLQKCRENVMEIAEPNEESFPKYQENVQESQRVDEEVPKYEENAVELAEPNEEKVTRWQENVVKIVEPSEENVSECQKNVERQKEDEEIAIERQTVPRCEVNCTESQANGAEDGQNAIPKINVDQIKTESDNGTLKNNESAVNGQDEAVKATVEAAVQEVHQAFDGMAECVADTKDVLLEVQAVDLLIHENEGQNADKAVPKCNEANADKTGSENDQKEVNISEEQNSGQNQSDPTKQESVSKDVLIKQGEQIILISQERETDLAQDKLINEEREISQKEQQIIQANEELITLTSQEEPINQEEQIMSDEEQVFISQINNITLLSPTKELEVEVQLQKLVPNNGIVSGEVGQIVADAIVHNVAAVSAEQQQQQQQQQQAVAELSVDEQSKAAPAAVHADPPMNAQSTTTTTTTTTTGNNKTTVLVVNSADVDDHDEQLVSASNSNDVNIVEVNSRKPSNV